MGHAEWSGYGIWCVSASTTLYLSITVRKYTRPTTVAPLCQAQGLQRKSRGCSQPMPAGSVVFLRRFSNRSGDTQGVSKINRKRLNHVAFVQGPKGHFSLYDLNGANFSVHLPLSTMPICLSLMNSIGHNLMTPWDPDSTTKVSRPQAGGSWLSSTLRLLLSGSEATCMPNLNLYKPDEQY